MASLNYLSNTKWKQLFRDRKKEFRLWKIPEKIADFCQIKDKTKRQLALEFDPKFNINIIDLFQVTSGREVYFPKELQKIVRPIVLQNPESYFTIEVLDINRSSIKNKISNNSCIPENTDGFATIKTRIGQVKFRQALINFWSGCSVTCCKAIEVLRASHIKPWSESSAEERIDPFNGLLLTPNLDVTFDCGLISFKNDGKMIISPMLSKKDSAFLNIHTGMRLKKVEPEHKKYLKYHREHKFMVKN